MRLPEQIECHAGKIQAAQAVEAEDCKKWRSTALVSGGAESTGVAERSKRGPPHTVQLCPAGLIFGVHIFLIVVALARAPFRKRPSLRRIVFHPGAPGKQGLIFCRRKVRMRRHGSVVGREARIVAARKGRCASQPQALFVKR